MGREYRIEVVTFTDQHKEYTPQTRVNTPHWVGTWGAISEPKATEARAKEIIAMEKAREESSIPATVEYLSA